MKKIYNKNGLRVLAILLLILLFLPNLSAFASITVDPSAPDYKGRKGTRIYVSKSGNNSDGSSWKKAYHTIQAALSAVPDDKGGHMIIVRPDTYVEANLSPAYKGAQAAYNLLIGDFDGRLGSGATGRIVIDAGDPQKGFKSYDWWGTIRSTSKGGDLNLLSKHSPVSVGTGGFFAISIHLVAMLAFFGT